jgi:hypothetical protein
MAEGNQQHAVRKVKTLLKYRHRLHQLESMHASVIGEPLTQEQQNGKRQQCWRS